DLVFTDKQSFSSIQRMHFGESKHGWTKIPSPEPDFPFLVKFCRFNSQQIASNTVLSAILTETTNNRSELTIQVFYILEGSVQAARNVAFPDPMRMAQSFEVLLRKRDPANLRNNGWLVSKHLDEAHNPLVVQGSGLSSPSWNIREYFTTLRNRQTFQLREYPPGAFCRRLSLTSYFRIAAYKPFGSFCARVRENETVGGYVKQTDQLTQLQDGSNVGKTSESITRGGITEGPQPKPLAQKPNREAAVFGWKCKYITIFREDLTTRISTSNLGDQETVFVRPLTTDQPGIRDAASALQFSSMGRRSTHTVTARLRRATSMVGDIVRHGPVSPSMALVHPSYCLQCIAPFPPPTPLNSPLTVVYLRTNLSAPASNAQLLPSPPRITGERNCDRYNRCTTSTRFLQLTMMSPLIQRPSTFIVKAAYCQRCVCSKLGFYH
ncbi:hypothetical protein CLF_112515, partial [Clonorchis sinensis]